MKQISIFTFIFIMWSLNSFAQVNLELRSTQSFQTLTNDIWGYAANGREYALLGQSTGTRIVDVTDPDALVDLGLVPGYTSQWRDIKVYENFAYVVNETHGGLKIIDLSNLPNPISSDDYYDWTSDSLDGQFTECHNLYIDEFGYAYMVGCDRNNGGILIYDLFSIPGSPVYVGKGPPIYCHDIYVRDNILYTSEIYLGQFAIYDASDRSNLLLLASQKTPGDFAHNAWLSDDSKILYTTDEVPDAPTTAYDVSDFNDIRELDQFRPAASINTGVIPHNVHVKDDWLVISHYVDGIVLVDQSRPGNLVEVGHFKTDNFPMISGFRGTWGAYPFLPSGNILASDINHGLFVLTPNYEKPAWLEGKITVANTNIPIPNVRIEIDSDEINDKFSNFSGEYKTGLLGSGTFEVTFQVPGFIPKTREVILEKGQLTILNVELEPINGITSGTVRNLITQEPIPNAEIFFASSGRSGTIKSDANGHFELLGYTPGVYTITVGKWGFHTQLKEVFLNYDDEILDFDLIPGYRDDFALDFGWSTLSDADDGYWTWVNPSSNPVADIPNDLGRKCYVTNNETDGNSFNTVRNGSVTLISPSMDLTTYQNPTLHFHHWYERFTNADKIEDYFSISVDNGIEVVEMDRPTEEGHEWYSSKNYVLSDYITITDEMRIIYKIFESDMLNASIEGGIDGFLIAEGLVDVYPSFSADATKGCIPLEVQFSDPSDSTTTWSWIFEGGSPNRSTLQNPTVVYEEEGKFRVSLETTTPSGHTYYIYQNQLIKAQTPPVVDFIYTTEGLKVNFSNYTPTSNGIRWEFGDGGSTPFNNPSHIYADYGIYTVSLRSVNDCDTTIISKDIDLQPTGIQVLTQDDWQLKASPNPFETFISINYQLPENIVGAQLHLYNILGQSIENHPLRGSTGSLQLGEQIPGGLYFIQIEKAGQISRALRIVKE